jgi:hypothetical protein
MEEDAKQKHKSGFKTWIRVVALLIVAVFYAPAGCLGNGL